jgi:hypothetical protein
MMGKINFLVRKFIKRQLLNKKKDEDIVHALWKQREKTCVRQFGSYLLLEYKISNCDFLYERTEIAQPLGYGGFFKSLVESLRWSKRTAESI